MISLIGKTKAYQGMIFPIFDSSITAIHLAKKRRLDIMFEVKIHIKHIGVLRIMQELKQIAANSGIFSWTSIFCNNNRFCGLCARR